jgi:hypothetical protein
MLLGDGGVHIDRRHRRDVAKLLLGRLEISGIAKQMNRYCVPGNQPLRRLEQTIGNQKNGDQYCHKQKPQESDRIPFSEAEKHYNLHGDMLTPF